VTAAGGRLKVAEARLDELRARAAGATRLDESVRMMEAAQAEEKREAERLPELERIATAAEEHAASLARELEIHMEALGAYRTASHQAELDRARWRDRVDDLQRQLPVGGATTSPACASVAVSGPRAWRRRMAWRRRAGDPARVEERVDVEERPAPTPRASLPKKRPRSRQARVALGFWTRRAWRPG